MSNNHLDTNTYESSKIRNINYNYYYQNNINNNDNYFNKNKDNISCNFSSTSKNNCINTLEPNNKSPIWDITVSQEGDFIAYTATEGIGAFILK